MNENEPPEASKRTRCPLNRGLPYVSGAAWQIPTYRPCGDRCRGGMTLIQAFVRNLRTGSVMLRDKAQSGEPTRPKAPMHRPGAHCSVLARKRSNVRGAKGAGHPRQDGVNEQSEELRVLAEAGRLPRGGTSRMNREVGSGRHGCKSGKVKVLLPSIACIQTASMPDACKGNDA